MPSTDHLTIVHYLQYYIFTSLTQTSFHYSDEQTLLFYDRDMLECKDREYCEWANVQSLKSSLDESRLEQRVKAANEAEAMSQQRLASGEAKIAELRGKMETDRRYILFMLVRYSFSTGYLESHHSSDEVRF